MDKRKRLKITYSIVLGIFILFLCLLGSSIIMLPIGFNEFYGIPEEQLQKSSSNYDKVKNEFDFPCKSRNEPDKTAFYVATYKSYDVYSIYCITQKGDQDKIVDFIKNNLESNRPRKVVFYEKEEWKDYIDQDGHKGSEKLQEKVLRMEILNLFELKNPFVLFDLYLR